ncbi:MAG TPA: hypothetical protein VGL56_08105 [Fimbriimonadaceae bacterium]
MPEYDPFEWDEGVAAIRFDPSNQIQEDLWDKALIKKADHAGHYEVVESILANFGKAVIAVRHNGNATEQLIRFPIDNPGSVDLLPIFLDSDAKTYRHNRYLIVCTKSQLYYLDEHRSKSIRIPKNSLCVPCPSGAIFLTQKDVSSAEVIRVSF